MTSSVMQFALNILLPDSICQKCLLRSVVGNLQQNITCSLLKYVYICKFAAKISVILGCDMKARLICCCIYGCFQMLFKFTDTVFNNPCPCTANVDVNLFWKRSCVHACPSYIFACVHILTWCSKLHLSLNLMTSYPALISTPLSHLTSQPNCRAFKRRHSLTTNIVTTTTCTCHVWNVGVISQTWLVTIPQQVGRL